MSTRMRNVVRTSIATLAVSVTLCALVAGGDSSAMGLRSLGGGMPSHGGGFGSHGLGNIGRGGPVMNRSLTGAAARPVNMGRSGNSLMSRAGRGEGLPRATAPQTSRLQAARPGSTGRHDVAPARRDDAKVKPNQLTDNRTVRNASTEKSAVTSERGPKRTDDFVRDHDRHFRDRDRYLRDRDDVPVLVPEIVPLIGTPTVEIVPTSPSQFFVPNGPVINVTRGDPPKANPPPVVVPTAVFGIPGMGNCPDPNCQALLKSVLKRQAMLQELKQDLARDEKKQQKNQKELADAQANLAKAKQPWDKTYWQDMINIANRAIAAYDEFIDKDNELIAEVEGMLRAAIADWQDCVKRHCPDKPGAVVFDQSNIKPDNNGPDEPF
jgi:hypothetical protein